MKSAENYKRFEDLETWKKARDLSVIVYKLFQNSTDFGFRDQIQRASVSVMNNIAEGYERGGSKEFVHFLYIAKGSCGEVRSMFSLGRELGYMSEEEHDDLRERSIEISRMLSGLIKRISE